MRTKRAKEVADLILTEILKADTVTDFFLGIKRYHAMLQAIGSLPEFAEPKWIKCSDRMPKEYDLVWAYSPKNRRAFASELVEADFIGNRRNHPKEEVTHWMPRHVPAAPIEEESELVKELNSECQKMADILKSANDRESGLMKALKIAANFVDIVKRHEKGAK